MASETAPDSASASLRFLAAGENAVLVEFTETDSGETDSAVSPQVLPFIHAAAAARDRPSGIIEVVPAARTVLIGFDPSVTSAEAVRAWCRAVADHPEPAGARGSADPRAQITIPVVYDGPDLADVAEATGMTMDDIIAAHTGQDWQVAFTGFAPGFGYLVGGDPRLQVPRRATPRTSVPAGSVGLAGGFSGVYPRSSPGGWQIIGHTTARLWRPDRDPPALLRPGVTVRFVVDDGRAAESGQAR